MAKWKDGVTERTDSNRAAHRLVHDPVTVCGLWPGIRPCDCFRRYQVPRPRRQGEDRRASCRRAAGHQEAELRASRQRSRRQDRRPAPGHDSPPRWPADRARPRSRHHNRHRQRDRRELQHRGQERGHGSLKRLQSLACQGKQGTQAQRRTGPAAGAGTAGLSRHAQHGHFVRILFRPHRDCWP